MKTRGVDRGRMQAAAVVGGNVQQARGAHSVNKYIKWARFNHHRTGLALLMCVSGLTACGMVPPSSGATSQSSSVPTATQGVGVEPGASSIMESCRYPQQFATARCNDLRHFGDATSGPTKPAGIGIRQWECQQPQNFRTAECNDLRHMGATLPSATPEKR
ncbi:MAG: hypothetical protein H0X37_03985 [Herpetosiphonaceae bacterium]|nr:hypothetical protein [Herpetosiphonaceae bacterium]